MEQQAAEVLKRLAVRIPSVRTQVASLSGGQRQRGSRCSTTTSPR